MSTFILMSLSLKIAIIEALRRGKMLISAF